MIFTVLIILSNTSLIRVSQYDMNFFIRTTQSDDWNLKPHPLIFEKIDKNFYSTAKKGFLCTKAPINLRFVNWLAVCPKSVCFYVEQKFIEMVQDTYLYIFFVPFKKKDVLDIIRKWFKNVAWMLFGVFLLSVQILKDFFLGMFRKLESLCMLNDFFFALISIGTVR